MTPCPKCKSPMDPIRSGGWFDGTDLLDCAACGTKSIVPSVDYDSSRPTRLRLRRSHRHR